MSDSKFFDALREQVGHEFAAHQQYIAIAVYYDDLTLPQLAAFFYRQSLEERNHAMMIVKYLMDSDQSAPIPGVSAPQIEFSDIVAPARLALEQEKRVTDQFEALAGLAREEHSFRNEQFTQWFLKEQVEEVSSMSDLVQVIERGRENPLMVEEFLARETIGDGGGDTTAPEAAGGAL